MGLTEVMLATSLKEAHRDVRKWKLEAVFWKQQLEAKAQGSPSENNGLQRLDEVMQDGPVEMKQTLKGPNLACDEGKERKKHFITLNDSVEATQVLRDRNAVVEKSPETNFKKEEVSEEVPKHTQQGLENVTIRGARQQRVTFSENTTSPKLTDRTVMRRNCRRIVLPKPVFMPSE